MCVFVFHVLVCTCVCDCAYNDVHIRIILMSACVPVSVCQYVRVRVCLFVCVPVFVCERVSVLVLFVCPYVPVCVCVRVCAATNP